MSDLHAEGKVFRRLKLRLGITKYLAKRGGSHYLGQVRGNCYWASEEELDGVIAELIAEGVLTKAIGRERGEKLVLTSAQPAQEAANGK
jgi:hypothetical protein